MKRLSGEPLKKGGWRSRGRQGGSPNGLMSSDIQIYPLLQASLPEDTDIRLIPDVQHETVQSIVRSQVVEKLLHESIVVRPVATISWPFS